MKRLIAFALGLGALNIAQAQHLGDVFLTIENGKIITGELDNGTPELNVHVFGMELGEDPTLPFYSEEPGFDNLVGTFTAGSMIGFEFTRGISKWNGSTFVDVANTVTATKAVGSTTLSATTGSGIVPGIMLEVASNGEWHEHYGWTLNGIGVNDPTTGVYRMGLRMVSGTGTPTASNEIWFIINNGESEENHDIAKEYAVATVPEPATMTALGLGALALMRKRKNRKS